MDTTPSYPLSYADALPLVREWFSRPGAVYGYTEGAPADGGGACVYRGNSDPTSQVRCSIGCLIPDHVYRPEMENVMAAALIGAPGEMSSALCHGKLSGTLLQADVPEFQSMQITHDEYACESMDVSEFVAWLTREIEKVGA